MLQRRQGRQASARDIQCKSPVLGHMCSNTRLTSLQVLVDMYTDLLRFYLKTVTLFERSRFVLGVALEFLKPEIAGIVSAFKTHADLLSTLLEAEIFAATQETKVGVEVINVRVQELKVGVQEIKVAVQEMQLEKVETLSMSPVGRMTGTWTSTAADTLASP